MDQYIEIISAADAWLIADETVEDEEGVIDRELKPTNSARRVKALVEQVTGKPHASCLMSCECQRRALTERFSPLPQFVQRTRFLITVQLPLLEHYHARISSSLDAFETLSSTFLRAVPGALGSDSGRTQSKSLTSGVEGVQRLCKALVSAKYTAAAMEAWGEDLVGRFCFGRLAHCSSPAIFHSSSLSYGQKSIVKRLCALVQTVLSSSPRTVAISSYRGELAFSWAARLTNMCLVVVGSVLSPRESGGAWAHRPTWPSTR